MHRKLRKQLERCNRLVVDTRGVDWTPFHGLSSSDFVITVQCLPIALGETLRLDLVVDGDMTVTWVVDRISQTEYYFHWPDTGTGGLFQTGGYDPETQKELPFGWKGALGHDNWMGEKVAGPLQAMLIWFYKEVDIRQQYPFIMKSMKDPALKKSPSKRKKSAVQTNVVVYLGRPPGQSAPKSKDGDEVTKAARSFGYPRRQHRRTLRSERFKNHPKYLVYKGVLVKQGWCGPKEYVHKRHTYRLWEPPEIDTTGS